MLARILIGGVEVPGLAKAILVATFGAALSTASAKLAVAVQMCCITVLERRLMFQETAMSTGLDSVMHGLQVVTSL